MGAEALDALQLIQMFADITDGVVADVRHPGVPGLKQLDNNNWTEVFAHVAAQSNSQESPQSSLARKWCFFTTSRKRNQLFALAVIVHRTLEADATSGTLGWKNRERTSNANILDDTRSHHRRRY
ncbi:hypothetical protein CCR75_005678 [Bremia lactucae]|uniref:Uncharacterized protein n=1 Tax=Bremia lactucae TaxID=4779 RepID=A0A976FLG1_BRELC|nr:hypothetical protein CCR75_005678 [Bremia lactucae]